MDSLALLPALLDLNIPKTQFHGFSITKTKILSTKKHKNAGFFIFATPFAKPSEIDPVFSYAVRKDPFGRSQPHGRYFLDAAG
jgi:hypothetical protein